MSENRIHEMIYSTLQLEMGLNVYVIPIKTNMPYVFFSLFALRYKDSSHLGTNHLTVRLHLVLKRQNLMLELS